MFGKKKRHAQIDKDQLELIEYAQGRIRQKKRLRTHVLLFFIGGLFLFLINNICLLYSYSQVTSKFHSTLIEGVSNKLIYLF
jgi:hypothetical protein